jgi:hypothetical protein
MASVSVQATPDTAIKLWLPSVVNRRVASPNFDWGALAIAPARRRWVDPIPTRLQPEDPIPVRQDVDRDGADALRAGSESSAWDGESLVSPVVETCGCQRRFRSIGQQYEGQEFVPRVCVFRVIIASRGGQLPYTSDFRHNFGSDRRGHGRRGTKGQRGQANRAQGRRNTASRPFSGNPDTEATTGEIHLPGMRSGRQFLEADAAGPRTIRQSCRRRRVVTMARPGESPRSSFSFRIASE